MNLVELCSRMHTYKKELVLVNTVFLQHLQAYEEFVEIGFGRTRRNIGGLLGNA